MLHEQPPPAPGRPQLRAILALAPGLSTVGVFLAWGHASGGYFPEAWYAGGLFLVALFLIVLLAWPDGMFCGIQRGTLLALVAFAGFTMWSYLSIVWADVRGDAWDGANRTALYLIVFTLFAMWRWTPAGGLILLGVFTTGVCLLGVGTLVSAAWSDNVRDYYISGRLADPVGYANGNAALFVLAFWPALFLASRREVPPLLRPLLLAIAGILLQLAVLPQSRGAAATFPFIILAYFGLVPSRLRSLVFLAPAGLALAAAFPRLLEAGSETGGSGLAAGARSAAAVIAISGASLFAAGLALVAVDVRFEISRRVRRGAALGVGVAAAALLATAIVVAAPSADLSRRASAAWDEFSSGTHPASGSRRLVSGFETNRADMWRVALQEFQEHPVEGIGAENYAVAYVRDRDSDEETLYPHSLPLQILAQTGLIGAALMVGFLVAAIATAHAALRRQRGLARGTSALGIVMFTSWFLHASIDWLWELPALSAPALGFLALAGSIGRPRRSVGPSSLSAALLAFAAVAVAISFAFPWLSAREARYAARAWRFDPAVTARLERARRLNPLSDRPDLTAGSIARLRQDWDGMGAAYARALERNPHNWYAHLQLALARSQQGRRADALEEVEEARLLNPSEPVLALVSDWLRRDRPVNIAAISRIFLERHDRVTR